MKNLYDQANDLVRLEKARRNIRLTLQFLQGAFLVIAISYISIIALALILGSL